MPKNCFFDAIAPKIFFKNYENFEQKNRYFRSKSAIFGLNLQKFDKFVGEREKIWEIQGKNALFSIFFEENSIHSFIHSFIHSLFGRKGGGYRPPL